MNRPGALCLRLRRRLARVLFVHRRDERGSSAVETLIMATAAMSLVLIVVASGRYVDASAQANDAAYAAARAASLETARRSLVTGLAADLDLEDLDESYTPGPTSARAPDRPSFLSQRPSGPRPPER